MLRKILIVDDHVINRQMLINALSRDYDILEASNGVEALAAIQRNYKMLSAVLLDIMMPEMDGYEVLRNVRENAVLSQIPIIMVTGSEDEESRVKALSLGANDFIQKPFNPEIVRHCLRNNIALRETASILNAIQKDKLTGLFNRETFFQKASAMIQEKEAGYYTLSSFDIDNFKLINDQFGASEGDRILKETGNFVKAAMEKIGGLAARISSDNFAALFPTSESYAPFFKRMGKGNLDPTTQWTIVFSTGRCVVTDTTLAVSSIYDRAYLAKQTVKKRFDSHLAYFDETMLQKLLQDQQIASSMETALAGHQFEIWLQPQYNHVTGTLSGAEALVRWRHPTKGIIQPGSFIPLFEQNGFVYELDKYVWREACRYLRRWMDESLDPLPVSVNISRYDIFRSDLIDVLTGYLREFQIPIDMLRLEITESAFAKSTERIVSIVKKLIALGFTVEIDDFGSGYSSLNTLKSVPAQILKLDMRFLEGGNDAIRGGNILESIVRMTKWLGMSVIAEGVETKAQGDFLKSIGCSHVQGYLYARPMHADDYEILMKQAKKEAHMPVLSTVENLNNDLFWNPDSMDSLIFNSYVGAACILEYCDGKMELLRATDRFAQLLDKQMTVDKLMDLSVEDYLEADSANEIHSLIESSLHSGVEFPAEFLFVDMPLCLHYVYLRVQMRIIASAENRYLLYCICENITEQRTSERKERETANRLQAVLDHVNCGITADFAHTQQEDFIFSNNKYYELLGYTREQYQREVGAKKLQIVLQDDRDYVLKISAHVFTTGEARTIEYRVNRRDGTTMWMRSYLSKTSLNGADRPVLLCTYTDITTEKQLEQDLLDYLPCGAGICEIIGTEAHMIYLNKKYYTFFDSDILSRNMESVFDIIHPDDKAILRASMLPAYMDGGEGSCKIRIQNGYNADGSVRYRLFWLLGTALKSENNRNRIYATFMPVAQDEHPISEMLRIALEKMMELSSDLSFIKDADLNYVCCSREFAQMVGVQNKKEIVGKTDYDFFDRSLADQYTSDDRMLIKSGKSFISVEEHLPQADGKNRYAKTTKYLLNDENGRVIGLYGIGNDITQTRKAQEQQNFLINNIPGGVAIYEGKRSDSLSFRLTYFSDGFCKLFGYTRDEYSELFNHTTNRINKGEYSPGFMKKFESLIETGKPLDYIFHTVCKDGAPRWIHIKATCGESQNGNVIVYALMLNVTESQNALEALRMSEEENRLALQHTKNMVCRYDVKTKKLKISSNKNIFLKENDAIFMSPQEQVKNGEISAETANDYLAFYRNIESGNKNGSVIFQYVSQSGLRWIEAQFSTIFASNGDVISAIISFSDITENMEKETAYKKWIQSIRSKLPQSYTLFRCNIENKTIYGTAEGSLLRYRFQSGTPDIDEQTNAYMEKHLYKADRPQMHMFLNTDSLREKYQSGERILIHDFREKLPRGGFRWLRLTVDLVEYTRLGDIEAYLLFEDIDSEKRAQTASIEMAENDALTGLLNRTSFAVKVNHLIAQAKTDTKHALIMLDIDGFKTVNDVFGHQAGDTVLAELANQLRTAFRRGDLIGRLGGDEFVVFLSGVPDRKAVARKAKQICDITRRTFQSDVRISSSEGIALCPGNGSDFDTLYANADKALYYVKRNGKDNYAFYREGMQHRYTSIKPCEQEIPALPGKEKSNEKKRRG